MGQRIGKKGRETVRGWEEKWKREGGKEIKRERKVERKDYRMMVEEKKEKYYLEYLEKMKRGEDFGFVKTDRDFMVDVLLIRGEGGDLVREDKDKGREILRKWGKREELGQEEERFWEELRVEEEEVGEMYRGKKK